MNTKHHCDGVPTKYIGIRNLQRETKRYLKPETISFEYFKLS